MRVTHAAAHAPAAGRDVCRRPFVYGAGALTRPTLSEFALSWAALYEVPTDQAYFEQLIPHVMEDIVMFHGIGHSTILPAPAVTLRRLSCLRRSAS